MYFMEWKKECWIIDQYTIKIDDDCSIGIIFICIDILNFTLLISF